MANRTVELEQEAAEQRRFWRARAIGSTWIETTGDAGSTWSADDAGTHSQTLRHECATPELARQELDAAAARRLRDGWRPVTAPVVRPAKSRRDQLADLLEACVRDRGQPLTKLRFVDVVNGFEAYSADPRARPSAGYRSVAGPPAPAHIEIPSNVRTTQVAFAVELTHSITIDRHPIRAARCVFMLGRGAMVTTRQSSSIDIPRWSAKRFFATLRVEPWFAALASEDLWGCCAFGWSFTGSIAAHDILR